MFFGLEAYKYRSLALLGRGCRSLYVRRTTCAGCKDFHFKRHLQQEPTQGSGVRNKPLMGPANILRYDARFWGKSNTAMHIMQQY